MTVRSKVVKKRSKDLLSQGLVVELVREMRRRKRKGENVSEGMSLQD